MSSDEEVDQEIADSSQNTKVTQVIKQVVKKSAALNPKPVIKKGVIGDESSDEEQKPPPKVQNNVIVRPIVTKKPVIIGGNDEYKPRKRQPEPKPIIKKIAKAVIGDDSSEDEAAPVKTESKPAGKSVIGDDTKEKTENAPTVDKPKSTVIASKEFEQKLAGIMKDK